MYVRNTGNILLRCCNDCISNVVFLNRVQKMSRGSLKNVSKSVYKLYVFGFGLVSLFNGISTLFRLFNAKAILLEEQ